MHDKEAPKQENKWEEVLAQVDNNQPEAMTEPPLTQIPRPTHEELMTQLVAAETKVQEHRDQLLRCRAELENLRRSRDRDVQNAHKYASEKTIKEFLLLTDSYEKSLEQSTNFEQLCEGNRQILNLMEGLFGRMGVKIINPQGESFDPRFHEAMVVEESQMLAPNTIIKVLQKGYLLHDRVVRPALVAVAKAAEQNSETA